MLNYIKSNRRESIAFAVLVALVVVYLFVHPRGASTYVLTIWANQCLILALAAMAQFFAVVTRGLDLSVGAVMALSNTAASYLLSGAGLDLAMGSMVVLAIGLLCGLLNGLIIVYGRVQPIIVTLATGLIFVGLARVLRPTPGGSINYDFADAMTLDIFGIPTALVILCSLIFLFWLPFRSSKTGLSLYAVGSSEVAAFQSGISVNKIRILGFMAAGLFAALAGLYYSYVTTTGDAGISATFTLNSIAAVVLGGVALRGGVGTLIGAAIGAFILKTIASLLFFSGLPPLAQPFVEGIILAAAIAIGSANILRVKSRLEVFDQ